MFHNDQNNLINEKGIVLRVAITVPLRRLFDYWLPENYPIEPIVGMRVDVPFGNSSKIGIINQVCTLTDLEQEELKSFERSKIKAVNRILDEIPLIPSLLFQLHQWMQRYYHAPPGEIWQTLLPNEVLKGETIQLARLSRWQITDAGKEALAENKIPKNAIKQNRILTILSQTSVGIAHDQLKDLDINNSQMRSLAGKGWVRQDFTQAEPHPNELINLPKEIYLTNEQRYAIDTVVENFDHYHSYLLFGVTASGKTEVYLRLIQKALESNKQSLVLVPEIGLTPQTLNRFKQRFNVEIVTHHSGMTDKQRTQAWLKAKNGDAKIIIGTRSALFVPLNNPGIIIIDEEHDRSFRQQQGFRYSARDVALVRAKFENIPVILGSASPSLESLLNIEKSKSTLLTLNQKAQSTTELSYQVLDLKQQVTNHGISVDLIKRIRAHLDQKGQVLLFLNRRGYSPVLLCHHCGWSGQCQRCDINFTYHFKSHYLQCHHCGSSRKAPHICPECNAKEMVPVGIGTERLEHAIAELFPQARVARIDRDTTRKKSAMTDFVSSIKAGEVDILIGTQMLAKGHHFPNVSLVAMIDMDGALYSADFRAPEYAAQLITQVSGRAGRAGKSGEVIIQTHHADHPMLKKVIRSGYREFAKDEIKERMEAEFPPHSFAAMFQAESPRLDAVKLFLSDVRQILDQYANLKVDLIGPAPAVYAKKAGKFRYQLFLQTNSRNQLHQLLDLTIREIESLKSASRVRWRLEIDPIGD